MSIKKSKAIIIGGSGFFRSCLATILSKTYQLYTIDKKKTKIVFKKKRKFDNGYLHCNIKKVKKILNWSPKFSNLNNIILNEI